VQENDSGQTSEENRLVDMAVAGDSEAFGRLYDMHVDRIYRHIRYRVNSTADAEDLTQQVFIKAWQAIGRYKKTRSPFLAWLMTISHNAVIDFYRSSKQEVPLEFDMPAGQPQTDPAQAAEAAASEEAVRKAIQNLRGDQQQVLLMRFIEDFSYKEIADALGKSEGAIRVILHRGLGKLKNIMEKAAS
jgi:RNA polymerase sigma-70 factor, ECF subfamily